MRDASTPQPTSPDGGTVASPRPATDAPTDALAAPVRELVLAWDHCPVLVVDDHLRTVWANEAHDELTGYRLAELVGQRPELALWRPEVDADVLAACHGAAARGEFYAGEATIFHRNGRPISTHFEQHPVHVEGLFDGPVVRFVVTVTTAYGYPPCVLTPQQVRAAEALARAATAAAQEARAGRLDGVGAVVDLVTTAVRP